MDKKILIIVLFIFAVFAIPSYAGISTYIAFDNWNFSINDMSGNSPTGLTLNSTHFAVSTDISARVYIYHSNGTYINFVNTSIGGFCEDNIGLTNNVTYFWIIDWRNDLLCRYNSAFVGDYNVSIPNNMVSVDTNTTYFWFLNTTGAVDRYFQNMTLDQTIFNATDEIGITFQLTDDMKFDGAYFYITDESLGRVYRLYENGTYDNFNESLGSSGEDYNTPAIHVNTTYLWAVHGINGNVSRYGIYTINYDDDYEQIEYEANTTTFDLNVTASFPNITDVNAVLFWNTSQYNYTTKTSSGSEYQFTRNLDIPIVETNETNASFYWELNITYNDSSITSYNTSENNQTILHSYYWSDPVGNVSSTYSGVPLQFNSTLTTLNSIATLFNITSIFNNTLYTPSSSGSEYYRTVTLPSVSATTYINYYYSTDITYNERTVRRESSISNVTVNPINISTSGTCKILEYNYWNEETPTTPINATMDMVLRIWGSDPNQYEEYSFNFTSNHTHSLYMDPCNVTFNAFSIQDYQQVGDVDGQIYPERHYYLIGEEINNVTNSIDIYLLNSTYADIIGISVVDVFNEPVEDVIVVAQRFYTAENTYRSVAMGYTDNDGNTPIRLRKSTGEDDIWYRFLLYRNYELVKTFDNTHIIEDNLIMSIETDPLAEFWQYYDEIAYDCSYNAITGLLLCEWEDSSNILESVNLFVQEIETVGYTIICNSSSTEIASSLSCDLSSYDGIFEYWLTFIYDQTEYIVTHEIIQDLEDIFGQEGVFGSLILFLLLVGIGYKSKQGMLIMAIVGLIIGFALHLTVMSITGLIGIIICIILILMKTGEH